MPVDMPPDQTPAPIGLVDNEAVVGDVDLNEVGFYVPPYLGPRSTLEIIADMPNLEVVQLLTVGVDAALAFVPQHVTLCNAVGVHYAGTAELAIALTLASLLGIADFVRAMPEGALVHERRSSLVDRKVLVIGAGGVGQATAARLNPFEVDVTVVGRAQRPVVESIANVPSLLPRMMW